MGGAPENPLNPEDPGRCGFHFQLTRAFQSGGYILLPVVCLGSLQVLRPRPQDGVGTDHRRMEDSEIISHGSVNVLISAAATRLKGAATPGHGKTSRVWPQNLLVNRQEATKFVKTAKKPASKANRTRKERRVDRERDAANLLARDQPPSRRTVGEAQDKHKVHPSLSN